MGEWVTKPDPILLGKSELGLLTESKRVARPNFLLVSMSQFRRSAFESLLPFHRTEENEYGILEARPVSREIRRGNVTMVSGIRSMPEGKAKIESAIRELMDEQRL
ncbi:MAG TPA: hypothetical protein PLF37_02220 [Planctomycetota bacterium]|nr:hypothetical protein [Planctomycetota bacterium]